MTYDKKSFLAGLRTGLALSRIPKEKPKATYLTGGPFTGTPSINTTYYTDHPPVPAEQTRKEKAKW